MPIDSTNARYSCRKKALIASVALVVCCSMSAASADATAEGPPRTLRALEELDSPNPASVHAYVQPTNEDIPSNQERKAPITDELISFFEEERSLPMELPKLMEGADGKLGRWNVQHSYKLLKQMEADSSKTIDQWDALSLKAWIEKVDGLFREWKGELPKLIFFILDNRMEPDDLVNFARAKLDVLTADEVLKVQRQSWKRSGKSDEQIFDLLKIREKGHYEKGPKELSANEKEMAEDEILKNLMKGPIFRQWGKFVFGSKLHLDASRYDQMKSIWSNRFKIDHWDKTLAAAYRNSYLDVVNILHKLQIMKWKANEKTTSEDVIGFLHLKTWKSDEETAKEKGEVFYSRVAGVLSEDEVDAKLEQMRFEEWEKASRNPDWIYWFDYMYLFKEKDYSKVLKYLVGEYGEVRVATILRALTKGALKGRAKWLQEIQFKSWKDQGVSGKSIRQFLWNLNTHIDPTHMVEDDFKM